MLIGALEWLEENRFNYGLKFEDTLLKTNSEKEKEEKQDEGGFKFPSWFTDTKYRLKQYLINEEKTQKAFRDYFLTTLSTTNFEKLSNILTKDDIELINVPGCLS